MLHAHHVPAHAEQRFLAGLVADFAQGEGQGCALVEGLAGDLAWSAFRPALLRQAADERRHQRLFQAWAGALPAASAHPSVTLLFDAFAVVLASPVAAVAVHGLLESAVAAELHAYAAFWRTDDAIARRWSLVLEDEERHLQLGSAMIRSLPAGSLAAQDDALAECASRLGAMIEHNDAFSDLPPARQHELSHRLQDGRAQRLGAFRQALPPLGLDRTTAVLDGLLADVA